MQIFLHTRASGEILNYRVFEIANFAEALVLSPIEWSLSRWDMFTVLQCSVYQVSISLAIITGAVSVVVALIGYAAVAFESRNLLAWVDNIQIQTKAKYSCLLLVHHIPGCYLRSRVNQWTAFICLSRESGS